MIDIDKLEQLRAAATQGPFVHVTPPPGHSFGFIGYYVEHEGERLRAEFPANDADDAYTVELLNAAPALLAEVRRLRNERDEARKEYEELLRRTEKREETERIVNAGSLPSHLERAEDRELDRLRAIEAAAMDAMRQIDRTLWLEHETGFLHDLRNNARICDLRVALAAKEGGK
ncbi:MAG: hypothetical protein INH34_15760 [Phycisphaerales bacterium]|nr:hypothetical protein [Phycisphaerales bacterium]